MQRRHIADAFLVRDRAARSCCPRRRHPTTARSRARLLVLCAAICAGLALLFGDAVLALLQTWTYSTDQQGSELGAAVSAAGNVNGDTWGDILVGAPKAAAPGSTVKQGLVYVFHGRPQGPTTVPVATLSAGLASLQASGFGTSVAAAGDINGDGYDDVVVGADRLKPGDLLPDAGALYIFYGRASGLSATPDLAVTGDRRDGRLGAAVAGAGDVNGDGHADVVAGAPGYSGRGAAYVFLGSASGLVTETSQIITGTQGAARFGTAVAGAGDINSDGFDDIVVGAPGHDGTLTDEGALFVYLGSAGGIDTTAAFVAFGGQAGAQLGSAVAGIGRANDDDYDDVAVAAPWYDGDESDQGRITVYYGGPAGLSEANTWSHVGSSASARVGVALAGGGDVDNDGYGDLLVGAPSYLNPTGGSSTDAPEHALVFCGSPTGLLDPPAWRVQITQSTTDFGYAVGLVSGANDDAYADIIVGAPHYQRDSNPVGRAFVFLGSASNTDPSQAYLPLVLRALP